ncbi:hypothetical protein RB200_09320 [Streptomyces sp. PmtG]
MRATRRTIRTAAIATGAIAALAVPTTAAFADTPSAPHAADGATAPGDQTDGDQTPHQDPTPTPDDKTTPDDHGKPDDRTTPDGDKNGDKNGDKDGDKDGDQDKPVPGGWESKGTVSLGGGWTAQVDVNASARSAKAQLFQNGVAKGSLKAYIKPASTKIGGCVFTLTADGTVTKTGTPTPPKPKPQPSKKRVFVREYTNLGKTGFDAKVYKTKAGYEADMIAPAPDTGKKTVWDTLKQTGAKAAYGQHNGAHFVLNPDGTMKGWVEGHKGGAKPTAPGTSTKVPHGGVKAGADGVGEGSPGTPLVAAGGGMAALGAAGLGFAMYRRRQNG